MKKNIRDLTEFTLEELRKFIGKEVILLDKELYAYMDEYKEWFVYVDGEKASEGYESYNEAQSFADALLKKHNKDESFKDRVVIEDSVKDAADRFNNLNFIIQKEGDSEMVYIPKDYKAKLVDVFDIDGWNPELVLEKNGIIFPFLLGNIEENVLGIIFEND